MFFVNISGYDLSLYENGVTPRLIEDIALFAQMITLKDLEAKRFVLVLNKIDLLERKIVEFGLKFTQFFPEYSGDESNPHSISKFIIHLLKTLDVYKRVQRVSEITATNAFDVKGLFESLM